MIHEVTNDTFEREVMSEKKMPVIVDFWAPWCGPCQQLSEVLHEVAEERKDVKVCKVNVDIDTNASLSAKFRIQNIPALLFIKNGEIMDSITGGMSKTALTEWINKNM